MIRMKPDGTLEFDTVDEAVAFQEKKSRDQVAKESRPTAAVDTSGSAHTNGVAKWNLLLTYIGHGKQRAFLRALRAHPDGITVDDAVAAVGVDAGSGLAGVIGGGLAKNVKSAGMEPDEVYITDKVDGRRVYRPGPALTKHEVPA